MSFYLCKTAVTHFSGLNNVGVALKEEAAVSGGKSQIKLLQIQKETSAASSSS